MRTAGPLFLLCLKADVPQSQPGNREAPRSAFARARGYISHACGRRRMLLRAFLRTDWAPNHVDECHPPYDCSEQARQHGAHLVENTSVPNYATRAGWIMCEIDACALYSRLRFPALAPWHAQRAYAPFPEQSQCAGQPPYRNELAQPGSAGHRPGCTLLQS